MISVGVKLPQITQWSENETVYLGPVHSARGHVTSYLQLDFQGDRGKPSTTNQEPNQTHRHILLHQILIAEDLAKE